jgi:putative NIF3 family GTP cyclohydrolase 1 type 2
MLTVKQIYNLAVNLGISADLRGKARVSKKLKREKELFLNLTPSEQKELDQERLTNPFSDTRILCGNGKARVGRVLAGIDIETGEVLLAEKLASRGKPIDLIISHHPRGKALARLTDVMELQIDLLSDLGVPINVAENLIRLRMAEVSRSVSSANHNQSIDAAKLLGLNFMCAHTAADNLVARFVRKEINKAKPEIVDDIIKVLKSIPEYQKATEIGAGPTIFAGSKERHTGKIALTEVTGGTSGHKNIYERLSLAGIGTIVGMHMSEEYKKEAEKYHMNVVVAGHMASDSLGLNLFLDELEKKSIEVIPCSGLIRVKRFKRR